MPNRPKPGKKPTIKDVAKLSGVCIATVSRVINNNYPVSDEVKQRVLKAIAELDYRPNAVARSLKVQRTSLIGVVIADLTNIFFMQLVRGIESELSKNGYSIIISEHGENPDKEKKIVEMFLKKKVAGIITTTCHKNSDYYSSLRGTGVPIVFVDRYIENFESDIVVEDNKANSYELVRHLIEAGHRKIAIVTGDLINVQTSVHRYQGYLDALEQYHIKPDGRYIVDGSYGTSYNSVKEMLMNLDRSEWPTAIYATNNLRAEGTLHACIELGIRIPEDISVVAYGNISLPWLFSLRLTHVYQDMVRIGRKAAEVVLEKIHNPSSGYKKYIIDSDIIFGSSVKKID